MLVSSNNNTANSNSYNQHSNSSHSMTTTNSTSTSTPTPGCSSTSSNHTLLEPTAAWAQLSNAGNSASSLAVAAVGGGPGGSRPPSRAPSILDSPTLARVERARLRLEATTLQQQQQQHQQMYSNGSSSGSNATTLNREGSLERSILDPKVSED